MGKIIFIVCFLVIAFILIVLALKWGKAEKPAPVYGEDLDYMVWKLNAEIERLSKGIPADIEANEKKIAELKIKLENTQKLKSKLQ